MLSLTVFIFAYNEAKSLGGVVKEINDTLIELRRPHEIVIIDDGSTDGTGEIADRLSREFDRVSVIHHKTNCGLGSVYKTAFANARCDLVTFFCGDGQFPPDILRQFLPLADDMDMVLGYLPHRKDPLISKALSKIEKILFRFIFGPMPKFQGVMMFRRSLLDEIKLKSGGGRAWTILMELIIRTSRGKYRLISVPTQIRPRKIGKSRVNNLPTIWANLKQAFVLSRYRREDEIKE